MMKKFIKVSALSSVIAVFACLSVAAQSYRATLVGRVTDPSEAAVPGATVTVTQNGTNFTQTVTANKSGEYSVTQLQPGSYTVKVDASGFKIAINTNVVLETDQTLRFDSQLEVGSVNETVTVESTPPVINSETPEKGAVITQRQVQELPLNGREFTDLAKLVPGIYARPSDDDQGQGLASAGTRTDSTNFMLDGQSNRSDRNGGVGVNTSVDSIQEFKVSTSTYTAEFGRLGGAQISVVTKSGTNRYSGTAFEFIRNNFFDAKNYFTTPDTPKTLRRHQFGGTFGGPLPFLNFGDGGGGLFDSGKDKTFFFTSFERTQQARSLSGVAQAPNRDWIRGDFRNVRGPGVDRIPGNADDTGRVLCLFRNNTSGAVTKNECPMLNVIPTNDAVSGGSTILGINPMSLRILEFFPVANVPGSTTATLVTNQSTLKRNLISAKIDRKLTDNNNLYFRIASDNRIEYAPGPVGRMSYPGFGRDIDYQQYAYTLGDTHSFSSFVVNEFRVGYLTQNNKMVNENSDTDYIGQFGIPGLPTGQSPEWWGFPTIRIDGLTDAGDTANVPLNYKFKNWQIADAMTIVAGNHNLKVGFDVLRPNYIETDIRNVRGDFRFRGRYTHPTNSFSTGANSFADFLYGVVDVSQRQLGAQPADLSAWQTAFFVQDNWRVKPWLTLNLGLRYDYTPYLSEKDNRLSTFVPELGFSVCAGGEVIDPIRGPICRDAASFGLPSSLVSTDSNNFAPRFGFALKVFKDDKTVIRGGAGIFYSTETINPARQQLANNYPYLFREQYSRAGANNGITLITLNNPFPSVLANAALQGVATLQGIPTDAQTPEVYQYNLTLEREIVKDLAFEIGYVGSQGRFLGMRYNLNAPIPFALPISTANSRRAFPNYSDITYQIQGVNSNYNALQASIRRRASNGLTLLASYTFGKAMDQNSNTFNSTSGSQRNPQNINNFRDEWALADYHRTHQFSASFNYDLPFGRGQKFFGEAKGWSQFFLGGWQMNGIVTILSGRPFTPIFSTADTANGRPDITGDPYENVPDGLLYNPFVFKHPTATLTDLNLYGNAGRNILTGPDFRNVDLSLFKNIRIAEKARLQLRWEIFNVFNRPNFQVPGFQLPSNLNTAVDPISLEALMRDTTVGRPSLTSNEAREMQFAARIIF